MERRTVIGRVLSLSDLTVDVLAQILQDDKHKQYHRAIAIAIANETRSTWTAKGTYLSSSTTSDLVVPEEIQCAKAGIYSARQVGYIPIIGISGVLTFSLDDGNILALMFSVPFNYIFHDNWWNAKVYNDKSIKANKALFDELYAETMRPIKGQDEWDEKGIGEGYTARGYMTSSARTPFLIYIKKL